MYDFHWSNATYTNSSRATIPLIRPHQCDSDGGRIRGVLLYYHTITEYGIKCCMHAHLEAPRAPPSRGELYRCKTLFLDNFPIFFYPNGTWTHPPPLPNYFWIFGFFLTLQSPLCAAVNNRALRLSPLYYDREQQVAHSGRPHVESIICNRGRSVAMWTFTGRVFHPAQRPPPVERAPA